MAQIREQWDYLIVTASNDIQSAAYRSQLAVRRELGLLSAVRDVLVIADPQGQRIGSGGSTILCLMEVLSRLSKNVPPADLTPDWCVRTLGGLRILIVHAGGDSKRLPAYGPCGKIFIPVPGESDSAVGSTLFDRQIPAYLALPPMPRGSGQIVMTAGDVLLTFDPAEVRFAPAGMTGLACHGTAEQAAGHGVFCPAAGTRGDGATGAVSLYLQKPSPQRQTQRNAADRYGRVALDIGVMNFDAATAGRLLAMAGCAAGESGQFTWHGPLAEAIMAEGLDFYREICCSLGADASPSHYLHEVRASGSELDETLLTSMYHALHPTPFAMQVVPHCGFLHFGTTRQIITSGADLLRQDQGVTQLDTCLRINSVMSDAGAISGTHAWVEACRIGAPVALGGQNVVVGVDVKQPLSLPAGMCLDVLQGSSRDGKPVWFVRGYGVNDSFRHSASAGGTLCGRPLGEWLAAMGATAADVWPPGLAADKCTLWNARVFPAVADDQGWRDWLWMFDPAAGDDAQRRRWALADRYSVSEMAQRADQDEFWRRRTQIRTDEIRRSLRRLFRNDSGFSAAELRYVLAAAPNRSEIAAELIAEAHWHSGNGQGAHMGTFVSTRILHTLATAAAGLGADADTQLSRVLPDLAGALQPEDLAWLESLNLPIMATAPIGRWVQRLKAAAFELLERTILSSTVRSDRHPRSALRSDEIVWGRAPARLDIGGGWTDTPPYTLEHGGCVINAAVNLNGQPPIHCYARVIDKPVIRIGSIDLGMQIEVAHLNDLLDYRLATSAFSLAKAAIALSGFSPEAAAWPAGATLKRMLELFGGGIELTTLAAIPKGSGLGTSSLVGAVTLAVVQRVMGMALTPRELFHGVLRLEQALTTGGGWQDQIGGVIDGVKVISTEPGLVPDAQITYVPPDVLDPRRNGGCTLLYYTGITRLAKNILQQVVGRYLDRDRAAMATLRELQVLAPRVAQAMSQKDLPAFGKLIDAAWGLNKRLDPDSTNAQTEALMARIAPHIHGAKLLGAGGGGFLLMICKTPQDAAAIRDDLTRTPPNDRARFFDFDISNEGLVVTVC